VSRRLRNWHQNEVDEEVKEVALFFFRLSSYWDSDVGVDVHISDKMVSEVSYAKMLLTYWHIWNFQDSQGSVKRI